MKKIFLLIFFNLILTACKDELLQLDPMDSAVRLSLREVHNQNKSHILLVVFTRKEFTCANYEILSSAAIGKKAIAINLFGIKPPPRICSYAFGPAVAVIDLGNLRNGNYELHINKGGAFDKGSLTITSSEIKLDFPIQPRIDILTPVLKRYL
ncbi:hypothetical protein [Adhaeribacter aquaticus]|uniref:hypothetical protein n=1 Tax=Adhaeribacter aquaticus TaxID=299567 RepID=UPI00047C4806|nr:hypothetical protein [Adhaeribacter aquaticus]